ncbi:hypothetical protein [Desulforamulus aquiferis]|uniref:Uncharacterized protein n=1 Tax=Desulforamulus aquiferis TaxID=1397668 RepID=A0AAW7ZDJ4_9FIRM|nr:hypothetical protein [Desulforamulus aquiferis]MDO7787391.1 hypothetical protein [Desulforamulus aquiferis]RYD02395.1 hypothetical protein N752_23985 [Desulforamulus aquiferis]
MSGLGEQKGPEENKQKHRLLTIFPTERIEDYVALSLALVIVIVILVIH